MKNFQNYLTERGGPIAPNSFIGSLTGSGLCGFVALTFAMGVNHGYAWRELGFRELFDNQKRHLLFDAAVKRINKKYKDEKWPWKITSMSFKSDSINDQIQSLKSWTGENNVGAVLIYSVEKNLIRDAGFHAEGFYKGKNKDYAMGELRSNGGKVVEIYRVEEL